MITAGALDMGISTPPSWRRSSLRGEFGDVDLLPSWGGKSPVRGLVAIFNLGVALENDGDAAALAEAD